MSRITTKNSTGDNMQPCLPALPTTKSAERVPLYSIQHLATFVRYSPSSQCHPEAISIHAIKVYKTQMQIDPVFSSLLDDAHVNVIHARKPRSEFCLLTIYAGIKMVFYPILV